MQRSCVVQPAVVFVCSLLVLACAHASDLPAPRFADQLSGTTVGQARHGTVRIDRHFLTISAWNGCVRYTQPAVELPATAGTVAFSVRVDDDFQDGCLLSDAYESDAANNRGTTWPSFEVLARRTGPATFRLSFGYWNATPVAGSAEQWRIIAVPLPTGQWHDVAVSWGPRGQMIWVGDRILASSGFTGPYMHNASTSLFRGWGLGCLYNYQTPGSPDPAPTHSAYPVSFRNLRLWGDQVWMGPRGKQK